MPIILPIIFPITYLNFLNYETALLQALPSWLMNISTCTYNFKLS
jgi:hypothetical protein